MGEGGSESRRVCWVSLDFVLAFALFSDHRFVLFLAFGIGAADVSFYLVELSVPPSPFPPPLATQAFATATHMPEERQVTARRIQDLDKKIYPLSKQEGRSAYPCRVWDEMQVGWSLGDVGRCDEVLRCERRGGWTREAVRVG
ncbi:hypothetical protein PM082_008539 [Marasmius tenuissimus]|nr:hypothetical protein PM082_008539 [Marasmius tenuissimus]